MVIVRSPCRVITFFLILFFLLFYYSLSCGSSRSQSKQGFLLLGLKNMNLHYILAPAVILQSCFSLVPSPEQLMLSQPDLISKTDCDLAVSGGKRKKSQANQKSPSAALPWGYSSPINVLFAKITDNSTIKGGRWSGGGIKERSSDTRGEKRKRETKEKQETEEVREKGAWTTEEKMMNGPTRQKEEEIRETNKQLTK